MDCNICERPDGKRTELTYRNGDIYQMYLCRNCIDRFSADSTVRRVEQFPDL